MGVALALAAAACWAGYILLSRRAGTHLPGVQGLALATAAGSLVALPVGVATAGAALLSPVVLGVGLAVALLSTAVPYGIDLQVLRRMPTALFSLLTCLSPIATTAAPPRTAPAARAPRTSRPRPAGSARTPRRWPGSCRSWPRPARRRRPTPGGPGRRGRRGSAG
ncbi:EamA family transporter [Micrococcus sp. JV4]|uniref:EamA family transporter n=1 Tax=Micrococcus sp. JV4 TaxID=2666106 RepID=UPI002814B652|nr:EamA family transporter [Micrococcus sp. JV4]